MTTKDADKEMARRKRVGRKDNGASDSRHPSLPGVESKVLKFGDFIAEDITKIVALFTFFLLCPITIFKFSFLSLYMFLFKGCLNISYFSKFVL